MGPTACLSKRGWGLKTVSPRLGEGLVRAILQLLRVPSRVSFLLVPQPDFYIGNRGLFQPVC
jgi:hypothetical protein